MGLVFASISLVATCLSVYWLVRMHRGFRHDLIILLIASDLIKSFSLVIYNIVSLCNTASSNSTDISTNLTNNNNNDIKHDTHSLYAPEIHHISSASPFCQTSGFIFATGIEGADAAVFFISLHSTVHIFWPNRAGGESGLYPYRRWVYAVFALWAPVMASLAFVGWRNNGGNSSSSLISSSASLASSSSSITPGYLNTGQACYLPTNPWWYRTALSWIPRYTILSVILLMYGSSYIYVCAMIRRYSRRSSSIEMALAQRSAAGRGGGGGASSPPPTPPLDCHGLVPEDEQPSESSRRSSKVGAAVTAAVAAAACGGGSMAVVKNCSPTPVTPPMPHTSPPPPISPAAPGPEAPQEFHQGTKPLIPRGRPRRRSESCCRMPFPRSDRKVTAPTPGSHGLRTRHRQSQHRRNWSWDGFNDAASSPSATAAGGSGSGVPDPRVPSPAVVSPGMVSPVSGGSSSHRRRVSSLPSPGGHSDEAERVRIRTEKDTSKQNHLLHQQQQQGQKGGKGKEKAARNASPWPWPSPSTSPSASLSPLGVARPRRSFYKHTVSAPKPCNLQPSMIQRGRTSPDFYRRSLSFGTGGAGTRILVAGNTKEDREQQQQHQQRRDEEEGVEKREEWKGNNDYFNLDPNHEGSNHVAIVSQVHINTMLRQGPPSGRASADHHHRHRDSVGSVSPVVALDQEAFESGGITKSRDRLRRQLRLLFIYPVVYVCVWVIPFTADMLSFSSSRVGQYREPYWMLVCTLLSLSLQGFCDSLVFCTRERPWRHMRGGFWENFGLDLIKSCRFTLRKDSGRTREEMFNDSAHARNRREEELERETELRGSPGGRMPPTAGGANWWDVEEGGSAGISGHVHKQHDSDERAPTSSAMEEERTAGG